MLTGRHKIKILIQKSKSIIYTCKMQILILIGLQKCPLYNIICGNEFLYKFTVCVTSEFRISVSSCLLRSETWRLLASDQNSWCLMSWAQYTSAIFTDFRDMLLLRSVFSCVWHFTALLVNMLCGEVTRKVWISLFNTLPLGEFRRSS